MELKDWMAAGYQRWETSCKEIHKLADFGLQKLIRDDLGKKYHITVYVYDRTKYPGYPWLDTDPNPYGFMPTIQFTIPDGVFFDLTMNGEFTIRRVEDELENLWEHFGRPYYELYEPTSHEPEG